MMPIILRQVAYLDAFRVPTGNVPGGANITDVGDSQKDQTVAR
jgi:hypothetical protein